MEPIGSLKLPLFVGGIAILLLFVILIFFPTPAVSAQRSFHDASVEPVKSASPPERASSEIPIRLKIPEINVDAALEFVGLTPQGEVGVPQGATNAAWFDQSVIPGEEGTAVIVGHFGWKDNIPAVFDDLSKLHVGDKLYVEDQTGTTTVFVVREIRTYGEHDDASSVLTSTDGNAHLNLITCEGVWNKLSQNYSDRLVVFTDKV